MARWTQHMNVLEKNHRRGVLCVCVSVYETLLVPCFSCLPLSIHCRLTWICMYMRCTISKSIMFVLMQSAAVVLRVDGTICKCVFLFLSWFCFFPFFLWNSHDPNAKRTICECDGMYVFYSILFPFGGYTFAIVDSLNVNVCVSAGVRRMFRMFDHVSGEWCTIPLWLS